jgi:hypothetical protein
MWGSAPSGAVDGALKATADKPRDQQLPAALYALLTHPEAQLG